MLFAEPVFHQPDRGPLYGAERDQSSPAGENRPRIQVRYRVVHVFCIRTLLTLILILKYQNLDSKGMKMAQMYTCLLLVWQHKNVTSVCSYIFRVSCVIDCMLFWYEYTVSLMCCGASMVWHLSLPLINSCNKTEATIFPMQIFSFSKIKILDK